MAWSPSAEYWSEKMRRIEQAIQSTEAAMANLSDLRQIEAHAQQVLAYRKSLAATRQRFLSWRNKRQNIERGAKM